MELQFSPVFDSEQGGASFEEEEDDKKVLSISKLEADSVAPSNPDNTLEGYENLIHENEASHVQTTPQKRMSILGEELPVGRALVFNSFGP